MSATPSIQSSSPSQPVEPPGYIERAVQYLANKIVRLAKKVFSWIGQLKNFLSPQEVPKPRESLPEPAVEQTLLQRLKCKRLPPDQVKEEFLRRVPLWLQKQSYEAIGKTVGLSLKDRAFNQLWRTQDGVRERYCEIGRREVDRDPYLIAAELEKALRIDLGQTDV